MAAGWWVTYHDVGDGKAGNGIAGPFESADAAAKEMARRVRDYGYNPDDVRISEPYQSAALDERYMADRVPGRGIAVGPDDDGGHFFKGNPADSVGEAAEAVEIAAATLAEEQAASGDEEAAKETMIDFLESLADFAEQVEEAAEEVEEAAEEAAEEAREDGDHEAAAVAEEVAAVAEEAGAVAEAAAEEAEEDKAPENLHWFFKQRGRHAS